MATYMDEKERARALELTLGQIEKQFGKGSIIRLGSKDAIVPVSVIPTGSISLDAALGVGGFPRGRIIEIYGPESSGKTTIALQVIAEAQKRGGMAAFIDVEHALDPTYARKLGVDVDNLLVSQPDYGEQALEITDALIASGSIDVLVVDSVAALVPKAELDGEMGDSHMGLQARLMSQALRKLTGMVSKSNTCLIFINQIREKIGVMFGNPGNHHRRPRPQVLLLRAARHPPHRRHQGRRQRGRQPHQGQGREEQGGPPLPRSRIRHHVRRGHLERRRPARPRRGQQHHREERRLVQLQGRAHRPGPRKRAPVPARQRRYPPDHRYRAAQAARADQGRARRGHRRRPSNPAPSPPRPRAGKPRAHRKRAT